MEDSKKYNYMEKTLEIINRKFISFDAQEVEKNTKTLESVLNLLIDKMKEKDPMFKSMLYRAYNERHSYGYLKIKTLDKFEKDLLLALPRFSQPVLSTTTEPGFVHLQIKKYQAWMRLPEALPTYKNFQNLLGENNFLDNQKILIWLEEIVQKGINDFPQKGNKRILKIKDSAYEVEVQKKDPSLSLKISNSGKTLTVGLGFCFLFQEDQWPKEGYKPNPFPNKPDFFIVPQKPELGGGLTEVSRYWRLLFQDQERALMDTKRILKPTIKLLKKLRDNLHHKPTIAGYHIKTAVLHIADSKPEEFWKNSLSFVFMKVLKEYKEYVKSGKIPYYWNPNCNLLEGVNSEALKSIAHDLDLVINNVENKSKESNTIALYLLTSQEYNAFAKEATK